MAKYIVRRFFISLLTVWAIATLCFFLLRLLPGNPFILANPTKMKNAERLMSYYGLDQPLLTQYFSYMKNLLHLDFGYSLTYVGRSVNDMISTYFPITAQLGLQALLFGIPVGMLLGILSAIYRGSKLDYSCQLATIVLTALPSFVLAARTLGGTPVRIVFRHILPSILGNMAVGLCSAIPGAIFAEAGMSYIGLGISPPATSLGQLATDGTKYFMTQFHEFIFPSIVIILIIFSLYMFGNALRDALDPKLRDEDFLARKYRRLKMHRTKKNTKEENWPEVTVTPPGGTFVMWTDYSKTGLSKTELYTLLEESGFAGDPGDEYYGNELQMRYSIAVPREGITRPLKKLKQMLKERKISL